MKLEKILAGIDFGKDTESVLAYAAYFAKIFDATLHLQYVIDYIVTPPTYLTPYIEEEKRIAEKEFSNLQKQLTDADIKTVTGVIVGRLHESFEAALKKTKADMLALGFISHALRRSSSEKLIKGLQLPILVVRGEKAESAKSGTIQIRKILCPSDFSEISKKALNMAIQLKDMFSSKLDVLHVCPDYVIKKMKTSEARDRAMRELHERAREKLAAYLSEFNMEEAGIIHEGDPYKRIISFSRENDIDLLVMGARGLGFIKGMLIGSVTDAVLKSSPCPVLVIH
jgi:nucleotide-binding universal stress UspA family protein